MAPPLRKSIARPGLMARARARSGRRWPTRSFRLALALHRDGRPADPARRSGGVFARRVTDPLEIAGTLVGYAVRTPETLRYFARGYRYSLGMAPPEPGGRAGPVLEPSPLGAWFDAHTDGLPLFKRRHYLDIYHRHLARFRGQPLHIVEIGVRDGGSLEMWRDYFGAQARVSGIDIDPACKQRESEGIEVWIGDQADPDFWAKFLAAAPPIDIVVDDGGHHPDQQAVTLECLLPRIRSGGVYICEDIGGSFQPFQSFLDGLARPLSAVGMPNWPTPASPLHQHVASVHRYPLMTVIEKPPVAPAAFEAVRRGGQLAQAR